jgi:thiosulfate dehydrogenase (quinone) large subunit
MFNINQTSDQQGRVLIEDPPIARFLFQSTIAAWAWLILRVWVGVQFLQAGWHKFNDPAWMDGSGKGILGFWTSALGNTATGAPIITYDWYRNFLQLLVDGHAEGWFSKVIVGGELAVGVGLVLGAFVGLAATGGLLLNTAFLLAGTTSTNPVLAILGILLILAWKNAGYVGLDRFLLPALGTPWSQPKLKRPGATVPTPAIGPTPQATNNRASTYIPSDALDASRCIRAHHSARAASGGVGR